MKFASLSIDGMLLFWTGSKVVTVFLLVGVLLGLIMRGK